MHHHDAETSLPRLLVYWRNADHQLFAFTASIQAPTPRAARNIADRQVPRSSRILAVKQSAGAGVRTLHRGRWIA